MEINRRVNCPFEGMLGGTAREDRYRPGLPPPMLLHIVVRHPSCKCEDCLGNRGLEQPGNDTFCYTLPSWLSHLSLVRLWGGDTCFTSLPVGMYMYVAHTVTVTIL